MSTKVVDEKGKAESGTKEKPKSGFKIGEFLQSPRRKRKQYIQLAVGEGFDKDLLAALKNHLQKTYPSYALAMPTSIIEYRRQLGRNITVSIIDDQFSGLPEVLESVHILKNRKQDIGTPVLFLTNKPDVLIESYHEKLLAYQENDDFVDCQSASYDQIFSRIKHAIEFKGLRRSRRFKVDLPVYFFHLQRSEKFSGDVIDMSIHGALLRANGNVIFKLGDQLRINIPVLNYLPSEHGDFLKVSAKVKRVFIGGDTAGVSFEHLSENQGLKVTKFLTTLVSSQIGRSGIVNTGKRSIL